MTNRNEITLRKSLIWRKICKFTFDYWIKSISFQCGNFGIFVHLFGKNFVKITFLLKKLLKHRFDEILFHTMVQHSVEITEISIFPQCGNMEIFSTIFGKNFVKVTLINKSYVLFLISRNFLNRTFRESIETLSEFTKFRVYSIEIHEFHNF